MQHLCDSLFNLADRFVNALVIYLLVRLFYSLPIGQKGRLCHNLVLTAAVSIMLEEFAIALSGTLGSLVLPRSVSGFAYAFYLIALRYVLTPLYLLFCKIQSWYHKEVEEGDGIGCFISDSNRLFPSPQNETRDNFWCVR
jgi:hypothetical protein